jgi:hypothetical protein
MIYGGLPHIIPVHWGLSGQPNRYGEKVEVLWLLVVSAVFPVLNVVLASKFGKYGKGLLIILGVLSLTVITVFDLILWFITSSVKLN